MCDALTAFIARLPPEGTFSVWYGPAVGEPWFSHHADARHYAASTMKLALLVAAYRAADQGDLDLDREVVVHDDFASAADGTRFAMRQAYDNDTQPWAALGGTASLRWLVGRAVVSSSNLATNIVLEHVGLTAVAATLAALGCDDSVVARGIEDVPAAEAGLTNLVTARDLARLLQALAAGEAASAASCLEMLATLRAQEINDALPAGLPAGMSVAHKSGWVEGVSHDAALVEPAHEDPFVLVVLTTSGLADEEATALIAAGAAAAWSDRSRGGAAR